MHIPELIYHTCKTETETEIHDWYIVGAAYYIVQKTMVSMHIPELMYHTCKTETETEIETERA